jgi:hypothetical protein
MRPRLLSLAALFGLPFSVALPYRSPCPAPSGTLLCDLVVDPTTTSQPANLLPKLDGQGRVRRERSYFPSPVGPITPLAEKSRVLARAVIPYGKATRKIREELITTTVLHGKCTQTMRMRVSADLLALVSGTAAPILNIKTTHFLRLP